MPGTGASTGFVSSGAAAASRVSSGLLSSTFAVLSTGGMALGGGPAAAAGSGPPRWTACPCSRASWRPAFRSWARRSWRRAHAWPSWPSPSPASLRATSAGAPLSLLLLARSVSDAHELRAPAGATQLEAEPLSSGGFSLVDASAQEDAREASTNAAARGSHVAIPRRPRRRARHTAVSRCPSVPPRTRRRRAGLAVPSNATTPPNTSRPTPRGPNPSERKEANHVDDHSREARRVLLCCRTACPCARSGPQAPPVGLRLHRTALPPREAGLRGAPRGPRRAPRPLVRGDHGRPRRARDCLRRRQAQGLPPSRDAPGLEDGRVAPRPDALDARAHARAHERS